MNATIPLKKCDHDLYGLRTVLFHTPEGISHATVQRATWIETHRIRSKPFRSLVREAYLRLGHGSMSKGDLTEKIEELDDRALYDGHEEPVFTRAAFHQQDGCVYIDLGDNLSRAVKVQAGQGWTLTSLPPVKFVRPSGFQPLPLPVAGGSVSDLKSLLHLASEDDFCLIVAWLLKALYPPGPFPLLMLLGEPGTCKSTTQWVLRELTDPNVAALRSAPRLERDLYVSANRSWVASFDNVSRISDDLSDALCRLATGGGYSKRALYTDADELIVSVTRPIVLNAISEPTTRGDLWDRTVAITLHSVPEANRLLEREIRQRFATMAPGILGSLLTVLGEAMAKMPKTTVLGLPRMADFVTLVTAAEPALGWPTGHFLEVFNRRRKEMDGAVLEGVPITEPLLRLVQKRRDLTVRAIDLLESLHDELANPSTKPEGWPRSPRALRAQLNMIASYLRRRDIEISFLRRKGDARLIHLAYKGSTSKMPVCLDGRMTVAPAKDVSQVPAVGHVEDRHDGRDGDDGHGGELLDGKTEV